MAETATVEPGVRAPSLRRWGWVTLHALHRYRFSFALVLTVVLMLANLALTSSFNWTSQLLSFAPLAIAAMASTPAILSGGGGFDLSISPLMILTTGVYVLLLAPSGFGGPEAVGALLLLGTAVGALNGLLILLLRIPPIVATLSMFFILTGVNLKLIAQPRYVSSGWIQALAGSVGPVPGPLLLIGAPLLVWVLLAAIPYRRALFAVGSNDATAFSSGVSVGVVRLVAYAFGGFIAAIGGIAVLAVTGTASAGASQTYTLQAIAAVALGGTSLWGGRGGLFGSVLGAASIYLLGNLLITLNVNPNWLQVMYGAMLLVAVVVVGAAARTRTRR